MAMNKIPSLFVIGFTTLLLTGCVVKRDAYDLPSLELPNTYKHAPATSATAAQTGEPAPAIIPQSVSRWWEHYGNEELNRLVFEGLSNNYQLKAAIQRIVQAHALADVEEADEWPELSGSGGYDIESPVGGIGSLSAGDERQSRHTYQVGVQANYEIDLWGKNRSKTEAAYQRAWGSVFDRETVALTLTSDITRNFVEYLSLSDRIANAQWTEATLSNMESAVRDRVEGGEATVLQLAQQRAAVAASKAVIPVLELQRGQRLNALALLVGKSPSQIKIVSTGLKDIVVPDTKSPGVPTRLLLRRPDIRSIEANLIAADADIDTARAELFPTIDLSAEAGFGARHLDLLFSPQSFFFNAAASVTQIIFDAGRRKNQIKFEEAQHAELVHNYSQAIYTAVKEVEDALIAIRYLGIRRDRQNEAVIAATEAYGFSKQSYEIGASDYLTLLDTERTLFRERDELQQVDFEVYVGTIDLFKALGGSVAPREIRVATSNDNQTISQPPGYFEDEMPLEPSQRFVPNLPEDGHWVHLASLWSEDAAWRHWRRLKQRFPAQLETTTPRIDRQHTNEDTGSWVSVLVGPFNDRSGAYQLCDTFHGQGNGCQVMVR